MFERTKDRYVTRGIMEQVPMELQMFLWHVLEQGQSHHGMDCLQVFKLRIDEAQNLHVHHSQERPGCQKTYSLAGVGADMPAGLDGKKIYAIDDGTHVTMLFASEY